MRSRRAFLVLSAAFVLGACTSGRAQPDDPERLRSVHQELPLVGQALPVESTVFAAPAPGSLGRIATDGTHHLAAWLGDRDAVGNRPVHAEFLNDDGTPLPSVSPVVVTANAYPYTLGLTWNGANFLVVWGGSDAKGIHVFGRRISPAGDFLDTSPRLLVDDAGSVPNLDIVSRESESLLVWSKSYTDLRYARIAADGTVLEPAGIALGTGAFPSAAWDGANYVVAWTAKVNPYASSPVLVARVTSDGTLLDAGGVDTGINCYGSPVLGAGPGGRLLAWTKNLGGNIECPSCESRAFVTRLGPSLEVLDADGVPVSSGSGSTEVMAHGGDFLLATAVGKRIEIIPVSASGSVGSSMGGLTGRGGADLAPVGTGLLGVFSTFEPVLAAPMRLTGNEDLDSAAVLLSRRANAQRSPALAADGAGAALVVWSDDRGSGPAAYARHLTATETSPDPASLLVGADTLTPSIAGPAVGGTGADYLVVWATQSASDGNHGPILGKFTAASSTLQVSGSTEVGNAPSVACLGSVCCVAWRDRIDDIRVSLVTPAGIKEPSAVNVSHAVQPLTAPTWFPASLAVGGHFVVLWNEGSATVELDGSVSDPSDQGDGVPFWRFAAASNGEVALAAWTEAPDETLPGPTYALVLGPNGERITKLELESSTEPAAQALRPAVGWDGANFMVVVRGRAYRVTADGRLLDSPGGFPVEPSDEGAIVAMPPHRTLYAGSKQDPALGVARLFTQTIDRTKDSFPLGAGCGVSEECASGTCEDGVCCEGLCGPGAACNLNPDAGQCAPDGAAQTSPDGPAAQSGGCGVPAGFARRKEATWCLAGLALAVLLRRRVRPGSPRSRG